MSIKQEHLEQMRHAVGFFSDRPGFRNAFDTDKDDPIWNELKNLGYAAGGVERWGSCHFWVTEKGEALIGLDEQKQYMESVHRQHARNIAEICERYDIDYAG